jgi:hypothetical protein
MEPRRLVGFSVIFVCLGLFGAAFAITGALAALPSPQVGGTCGPGSSSESSIVAFFDPGSIGAHAEPLTVHATDRAEWMAFVGECQSSADGRVLASFAILVLSVAVGLGGLAWAWRAGRRRGAEPQSSP